MRRRVCVALGLLVLAAGCSRLAVLFIALEGPETVVSTLAPYVVNLHVEDFVIRRVDHQMGFVIEGCPAGRGRLDIPRLLEQLRSSARPFNAILEQWPSLRGSIEETVAEEDRWAKAGVDYLRGLITE
jgi:hypothetical protein